MEYDSRSALLNSLLMTPHGDLASLIPTHLQILEQDPQFYVRLAAWYFKHGAVRDHREMFVSMLCTSYLQEHRRVGLALLHTLPPYQVARAVDFIKGRVLRRTLPSARLPSTAQRRARPARRRLLAWRRLTRFPLAAVPDEEQRWEGAPRILSHHSHPRVFLEPVGLFRNVPRSMRTEIASYLRKREANDQVFDRAAMSARAALKRLYAGLHIRPSARAQAVLFDNKPPAGSLAAVLKQIARMQDPAAQASALVEHRIPYRVAVSIVSSPTPMLLAALIDVMTPQEVINNLKSLKRQGALDDPDLYRMIEGKLVAARNDARVSAYKAKVASRAARAKGSMRAMLDTITEQQLKKAGRITKPTALLIDKSGSMRLAMEVGRHLGAMISSICEAELFAYAFDIIAHPILSDGPHLFQWERAMGDLHANGSTSCGIALELMRRGGQLVEQIVFVTDENENHAPLFREAYQAYATQFRIRPAVIIVRIGHSSSRLENDCASLGVAPHVFAFSGDYYALPNVIPLLTYPSLAEMVMQIMKYPLPERRNTGCSAPILAPISPLLLEEANPGQPRV